MSGEIQYRFRPSGASASFTQWKDWPVNTTSDDVQIFQALGFSDGLVQVRIKPEFEPGYYEANTTTHDVRWFTSPPENPAWRRVEVTRVDQ